MAEVSWLIPLLLLPGVGLLLMSTSLRYGQLHDEIHHVLMGHHTIKPRLLHNLRRRVTLFRNALVGLYLGAACFAIGSITGALVDTLGGEEEWVVIVFSCAGILGLVEATLTLVYEAMLLLQVTHSHLEEIMATE